MVQVHPGDVLLFSGRGFVAKAIRLIDGSEIHHVAIALTDKQLAEAAFHGLDVRPINVAVEGNDYILVGRTGEVDPVEAVRQAREYLADGIPYAYHQILLLAGLCVTRRIPIENRLFRRLLRRTLEAAAELLSALLDRGAELMICSEYVYRCYRAAGFDLLPEGVPDHARVAADGEDGMSLLDWLEKNRELTEVTFPENGLVDVGKAPAVAFATAGTTQPLVTPVDPATIAELANYELEGLAAEYFASLQTSEGMRAGVAAEGGVEETVGDEELMAAAVRLAAVASRVAAKREGREEGEGEGVRIQGLFGASHVVRALSSAFSTNANFVTPRDLLMSDRLEQVGKLT